MSPWSDVAACTIVSKNYLALARTLARSYREQHPGSRFFVLLCDRVDGRFDPAREPFDLIEVEALGIPDFREFAFKYSILELNTAVKARFLARLLELPWVRKVLYFDPDILVFRDVAPIADLLERHAIVLTPHLRAPYDDGLSPTELDILQAGVYNLGFIGLSRGATTDHFLRWWAERLDDGCQLMPDKGMHVDQRWVDFVPGFYDDVAILRDPGCNVAYWNLHERSVRVTGDEVAVNGGPCRFVHFSGFDPADLSQVSRHQTRFSMAALGDAAALFRRYRELLLAHGHAETRTWPYAYGAFSHGVPIPDVARQVYRALGEDARRFGDPFDAEHYPSFFEWLRAGVGGGRPWVGTVSRLWYEIYHQQSHLQFAFPDVLGRDREAFIGWILAHGARDHRVDPAFLPGDVAAAPRAPASMRGGLDRALLRTKPALKLWVKRRLLAHPRLLRAVRRARNRLRHRRPEPVLAPARHEPGAALQSRSVERVGVNVAGYFNSEKGVGEAARSTVLALRAADVPVELNNVVDFGSANREATGWRFRESNPHPVNLIHVNADQVPVFAESRRDAYFRGRVNIGFWFWELSTFPDEWRSSFEPLDEVWAATAFAQDAIARAAPFPVVRMPVAIEPKPAAATAIERSRFGLPEDAFVFLFVFDFHSYLERKNPVALIEAFRLAFGDRNDVVLVLKSAHAVDLDTGAPITQVQDAAARLKNVRVLDTVLAREDLDALFATADCYASLHRSEGFGLPIAESMSRGTPVIVTAYSGNMDFTTPANSLLVKYRLVEIDRDHGPYRKGNLWADPDPEHAAELMRWVVEHPEAAREIGRHGREHIERFHAPRVVGELMRDRLTRLASRR